MVFAGLAALFCLVSCTTVRMQSALRGPDGEAVGETVVLLSTAGGAPEYGDDEVDHCIGSAMRHVSRDFNFVKAETFREHLYPWFMPGTTPHTLEGYQSMLEKPEVSARIAALKVRYLIVQVKSETTTDWHGGILCGVVYGGGGCLGLSWWDRRSDFGVAIWDLKQAALVGRVQAQAAGTGIMPAFVLPIPVYVPATESAVCREIGTHLAILLRTQMRMEEGTDVQSTPSPHD